jgi:hypothetical protein
VSSIETIDGSLTAYSRGAGLSPGKANFTLEEARAIAEQHGMDMRMFELKPLERLGYEYGCVSVNGAGAIWRGATGKIVMGLSDLGLSSRQAIVETVAHELNHVRGWLKTGTFSPEASAEGAAEAARPFVR